MSKYRNNVNPDHYKTKGSTRPGDDILQEQQKQKLSQKEQKQRLVQAAPHLQGDEAQSLEDEQKQETIGDIDDSVQDRK